MAFYQCLEDYWQEFKDSYSYFYESESASLRPLMEKIVQPFLMMIDRRPQLVRGAETPGAGGVVVRSERGRYLCQDTLCFGLCRN